MENIEQNGFRGGPPNEDHTWVIGGNETIVHKRLIDEGAYGEVHHLFDTKEDKPFARKVVHIRGTAMRKVVESETRILLDLQKLGDHGNIIRILGQGWLPKPHSYFYIDMDLCDCNLHDYIFTTRMSYAEATSLREHPKPVYVPRDSGSLIKLRNTWTIVSHISDGLEFIHKSGHVHRDLKPRNVLFSRKDGLWKIADFGLSTEATSKHARTTVFSNGTPCYRAPELLRTAPTYTNKVDIWGLGCILYELLFEQKLFNSDWEVSERKGFSFVVFLPRGAPESISHSHSNFRPHVSGILERLLDSSWESRPRAEETSNIFRAYIALFHPSRFYCPRYNLPSYQTLIQSIQQTRNETGLLYAIGEAYYESGMKFECHQAWAEVVRRSDDFIGRLQRRPDLVEPLHAILEHHGFRSSGLTWLKYLAGVTRGNNAEAIGVVIVKMIASLFPDKWNLLLELSREANLEGNRGAADVLCEELVDRYPWHGTFRERLSHQLETNSNRRYVSAIWTRLISKFPTQDLFIKHYCTYGPTKIVVRFTDLSCFQEHQGLDIGPFDIWRNPRFKTPIACLIIDQDMTFSALYRAVAERLSVTSNRIFLRHFANNCRGTISEDDDLKIKYLCDLFPYPCNWSQHGLYLYVERYDDAYTGAPHVGDLKTWSTDPHLWRDSRSFVFIFLKHFDVGNYELKGIKSIYVAGAAKIRSLTKQIDKDLSGLIWFFRENPCEALDKNRTFAESRIRDGDIIWVCNTVFYMRKLRESEMLLHFERKIQHLQNTLVVNCFPRDVIGDVHEFVKITQGNIAAFDCVVSLSMTYQQLTEPLANRISEFGRQVTWTQIRLFPSDVYGKPCSEPLPSQSDSPVARLMMDNNGAELPPIIFYEIIESSPRFSSNKRSGEMETDEVLPSTKRFKQLDPSVVTASSSSSSYSSSTSIIRGKFASSPERKGRQASNISSLTSTSSLASTSPMSYKPQIQGSSRFSNQWYFVLVLGNQWIDDSQRRDVLTGTYGNLLSENYSWYERI